MSNLQEPATRKHGAARAQSLEDILLDKPNPTLFRDPLKPNPTVQSQIFNPTTVNFLTKVGGPFPLLIQLSIATRHTSLLLSFSSRHPYPKIPKPNPDFEAGFQTVSRGSTVVEMSCNGCRVLRKGCSETCILRSCLHWISSPDAQAHATLFLAKFFGRSDLMSLISAVPDSQRSALFQSLLFEACGRTVNPVNGAVGLLWSGNWHVCQAAVETVLSGGILLPLPGLLTGVLTPNCDESSDSFSAIACAVRNMRPQFKPCFNQASGLNGLSPVPRFGGGRGGREKRGRDTVSCYTEESGTTSFESSGDDRKKLLNLFT